jgi:hypothetical protein
MGGAWWGGAVGRKPRRLRTNRFGSDASRRAAPDSELAGWILETKSPHLDRASPPQWTPPSKAKAKVKAKTNPQL